MVEERTNSVWRVLLAAVVLGLVLLGIRIATADAVQAAPDIERGFVDGINKERAKAGAPPLIVDDGLVEAARDWAADMLEGEFLAHAGDITTGVPPGWTKAGENVGRGESVPGLMEAFMDSPGHRRNVLDPDFTHVGIGSFVSETGVLYTTHRFVEAPIADDEAASLNAVVVSSCPDGHGRLTVTVTNNGEATEQVTARLGALAEQALDIAPGDDDRFVADHLPDGQTRIKVAASHGAIFDETVEVGCRAQIGAVTAD